MMMTAFALPRRLGLSGRLLLLIVALVFSVLAVTEAYFIRRQVTDLRAMAESKKAVMRAGLAKKGMMLVQTLALSSQRALLVRDYLFLYEAVSAAVTKDEEISYGIIMDHDRRALVHTDRGQANQVLEGEAARFAAATGEVAVQEVSVAGIRRLEAVAPIVVAEKRWGTFRLGLSLRNLDRAVRHSETAIRAQIRRNVLVAIGSALVVLLLGSLAGIVLIRRIVLQPLDRLGAGVQRIRGGDFSHQLQTERGSPEWVDLAVAFNEMSAAIAQRNRELEQLNRELMEEVEQRRAAEAELAALNRELEQRVAERTRELSQANADLSAENARRLEAEQELRLNAEQLRRSNRDLEDFAYVASHDLQEPLRKVQTFGDRLQAKYQAELGEKGQDYLGRMLNAAGRMRSLITELLEFSRVTTRAKPFEVVDLSQVIGEVLSDLEVAISTNHAQVIVGDLPQITADVFQMRQIFQNLIGNALKFQRPDASPRVEISVRRASLASEAAEQEIACHEISVRDNGIGFDQQYASRIFGVFQRLHGRSKYEGTGMGLAICRKIAERHGGKIEARSADGEGATFIISIPVDPELVTKTTLVRAEGGVIDGPR